MPRRKRQPSPTGVYHWINRGINQKELFHRTDDFHHFFNLLKEYKDRFSISIYHYCLMTNHVHMLILAEDIERLAKFSHYVQRRYAYYYSKSYRQKGQVFQRMYRSLPVEKDSYLLECGRYIERNPLRAGMVKQVGEYPYTSFAFYSQGAKNRLITSSPAYLGLADTPKTRQSVYANYVCQDRPYESLVDRVFLKS